MMGLFLRQHPQNSGIIDIDLTDLSKSVCKVYSLNGQDISGFEYNFSASKGKLLSGGNAETIITGVFKTLSTETFGMHIIRIDENANVLAFLLMYLADNTTEIVSFMI